MKRSMRKILSILLVCVLLLPGMETAAESYDFAQGTFPDVLFPGESLSGIASGTLTVDGVLADAPEGIWTNNESGRVYSVAADEAGSCVLTACGYTLTVKGGSSRSGDGSSSESHQSSASEGGDADVACYKAGDQVVVTAGSPEEGMQFSGWTVEASGLSLDDPTQSELTITMPEEAVVLTAGYTQAVSGPESEAGADSQPDPVDGNSQDPNMGLMIGNGADSQEDPADGNSQDPNMGLTIGDGADSQEDPADGNSQDPNMGLTIGDGADGQTDPADGNSQDPNMGLTIGDGADGQTDPANGNSQDPNMGLAIGDGNDGQSDPADGNSQNFDGEFSLDLGENSQPPENGSTVSEIWIGDPASEQTETYQVTVESGEGTGTYAPGELVTITAEDRTGEGETFSWWFVSSLNASPEDPSSSATTFVMPAEDVAVSAVYDTAGGTGTDTLPAENGTQETGEPAADTMPAENGTQETGEPAADTLPAENGTQETGEPAADTMPAENETQGTEMSEGTPQTELPSETSSESETENQTETKEPETESETSTEPQVYRLTVENGEGSGEYEAGAVVAIEAKERDGMTFAGWVSYNDKAVISSPAEMVTTLVMPAEDVTVAADYVTAQYKVTLDYGNGVPTENTYAPGDTVTVTALDRESENLQFDHWEGTQVIAGTAVALKFADPTSAVTTFVMPEGEVTISASYVPIPTLYHVTVSNGLLNGAYTEMDCMEGDTVTVAANPGPEGQKFSRWEVNKGKLDLGDQTYSNTITVSVTEDMDFLAVYEGIEYKVTVNDGTSDYSTCTQGTTVTLRADEAPAGMLFDHWEADTGNISFADSAQSQTTFVMPAEDVEVSAYYRRIQYQVAVENGTSDAQYYYMGDQVTVSSSYPASGRVFDKWVSDSGNVNFADSGRWQTTFTMPASNVVVKAAYTDGPSPDGNTIQNITPGGQYYTGDTIEFTASGVGMDNTNPNPGDYRYRPASYQIGNVTGTWQGSPYSASMAINAAGEYTLKVIYNKDVYTGSSWNADGTVDTKSVTFRVNSGRTSVETGDETPIELVVGVLIASGLVFIVLLVLFLRRRRRR